jgi:hypothetical protein
MAGKIEIHAVGATRWVEEGGKSPIYAPLEDAIVRLISEEDIALCVTRRSLGEVKTTGQFLQRGARGDHTGSDSARTVFHKNLRVAMNMKSRIGSIDIKGSAVTYELGHFAAVRSSLLEPAGIPMIPRLIMNTLNSITAARPNNRAARRRP